MLSKHLLKGPRQGFRKALVKGFHKPLLKPFVRAWRQRWVNLHQELHPVTVRFASGVECTAPDPVADRLRCHPEAPGGIRYGQPQSFRRDFRRTFCRGFRLPFR